jgi:hypothetical protein
MFSIQSLSLKTKINCGVLTALVILFTTTQPGKMPTLVIALVFSAVLWLLFAVLHRLVGLLALPPRKQFALSLATTVVLGLMVVLQTLGQLTIRDFLSFVAIFAVGWLYVTRFSLKRSP